MTNISKWCYTHPSNSNYGVNSIAVQMGPITFYFSYDTIVAYSAPGQGLVLSENVWGSTTGRHLNKIGGHGSDRTPRTEFIAKLNELVSTIERAMHGTIAYQNSDLGVIVNN